MKSSWAKLLCRMLMVLMIWSPVQFAQAGMIGTDQLVTAAANTDRSTVAEFLSRADVANQLQSFGLDANSRPAGADSTGVVILLIVVGVAVWWIWFRR
jgi:hypothetical protein